MHFFYTNIDIKAYIATYIHIYIIALTIKLVCMLVNGFVLKLINYMRTKVLDYNHLNILFIYRNCLCENASLNICQSMDIVF